MANSVFVKRTKPAAIERTGDEIPTGALMRSSASGTVYIKAANDTLVRLSDGHVYYKPSTVSGYKLRLGRRVLVRVDEN
jgi:hypothetical protein